MKAIVFDPETEKLQKALNRVLGADLREDGILGPETEEALKRFQQSSGLYADGVPGPATQRALGEALAGGDSIDTKKQGAAKSEPVSDNAGSLEDQLIDLWLDKDPDRDRERAEAQAMLLDPDSRVDRKALIERISWELSQEKGQDEWGPRGWLLGSLARIADKQLGGLTQLRRYMDPKHEPEPFVRYWTLAGAYYGHSPELMNLASRAMDEEKDPLVRRLAEAIFAERGDEGALESLRRGLGGDNEAVWLVLRALRVVPLPQLREPVAAIEREAADKTLLWNARQALERMKEGGAPTEGGSTSDDLSVTVAREEGSTPAGDKLEAFGHTDQGGHASTGTGTRQIWLLAVAPEQAVWKGSTESPIGLPVEGKTAAKTLGAVSPGDLLVLYEGGKAQRIVGLGSVSSIDVATPEILLKLDALFEDPIGRAAFQDVLPELMRRRGMLRPVQPEEWATLREIVRFQAPESVELMPESSAPTMARCDLLMAGEAPDTLTPGASYDLALKVVNTGNVSWKKGDAIMVQTPGLTKEDLLPQDVPPGGARRIDLALRAPSSPGKSQSKITARVGRFGSDFMPGTLTHQIEVVLPQEPDVASVVTTETPPVDQTTEVEGAGDRDAIPAEFAPDAEVRQPWPAETTNAAPRIGEDPKVTAVVKPNAARSEAAAQRVRRTRESRSGPAEVQISPAVAGAAFPAADRQSVTLQIQQAFEPPEPQLGLTIQRGSTTLTFGGKTYSSPTALLFDELRELRFDSPELYGGRLFSSVIRTAKHPGSQFLDTRHGYQEALRRTAREVRFELHLDAGDAELRSLRWEYLTDPESGGPPIAVSQHTPFYRLVGAQDLLDKPALPFKVLVAIASPDGLGQAGNRYLKRLPPLDVARERQIIVDALSPLEAGGALTYEILDRTSGNGSPAVENIAEALKRGYQVLHLLAHGFFIETGEYCVALPGKQTPHELVTVSRFRAAVAGHDLRLAVLQTCQSFSVGSPTSGQALGLELVEAGIPAVISMQGRLPIETAQLFTQHFYHDLARSGRVDMAVAATRHALYLARQRVGSAWDWGIPVLQQASSDGRLFDVKPEEAVRLGDPDPRIKSASELPSSALASRASDVADGVVREVAEALRAAGSDAGVLAPLGERIRSRLAAALPEGSAPSAEPPQDRAALRWTLRSQVQLRVLELRQWVERGAGMRLLPSVYRQVVSALNAGKHVVLIGPPGTGKTTLAHAICDYARSAGFSAGSVPTTASADWTTFDTVGGYALTPAQALEFRPGIFLRAISGGRWLVIDEINRAEIDKAVGELFTLLSGQQVDLPYRIGDHRVRVLPPKATAPDDWVPDDAAPFDYVVHPNWRILATMNVYDKSSLFSMSFAFMRRFAFVDVGVPYHDNLFQGLRDKWIVRRLRNKTARADRKALRAKMNEIFRQGSPLMRRRELGPAIASDMLRYVEDRVVQVEDEQGVAQAVAGPTLIEVLGEAFLLYAVPQLDGLDRDAVLDVYGHIAGMFAGVETGRDILQRVQDLYPHIREEEWTAAQQPLQG